MFLGGFVAKLLRDNSDYQSAGNIVKQRNDYESSHFNMIIETPFTGQFYLSGIEFGQCVNSKLRETTMCS